MKLTFYNRYVDSVLTVCHLLDYLSDVFLDEIHFGYTINKNNIMVATTSEVLAAN